MEENKCIAKNLTTLRKYHKITQGELAEKLKYSDKTVSKWENGDAVPDVLTTIEICNFFEVSMDDFCKTEIDPTALNDEQKQTKKGRKFTKNQVIITLLSVLAVWLVSVVLFVNLKLTQNIAFWMAFIWAVVATGVVLVVFSAIWGGKKSILLSVSFLVWSILVALHLQFLYSGIADIWPIYFIGIPIQLAIILALGLHRNKNQSGEISSVGEDADKTLTNDKTDTKDDEKN